MSQTIGELHLVSQKERTTKMNCKQAVSRIANKQQQGNAQQLHSCSTSTRISTYLQLSPPLIHRASFAFSLSCGTVIESNWARFFRAVTLELLLGTHNSHEHFKTDFSEWSSKMVRSGRTRCYIILHHFTKDSATDGKTMWNEFLPFLGWRNQPHHWRQQPLHVSAAWLQWRSDKPRKCGKEMHPSWSHGVAHCLRLEANISYDSGVCAHAGLQSISDWNIYHWNMISSQHVVQLSSMTCAIRWLILDVSSLPLTCREPKQRALVQSTQSTQSTVLSHVPLMLLIYHGNHISSINRKFLAKDFRLTTSNSFEIESFISESSLCSIAHSPFCSSLSPKRLGLWDFVNRALVETATGTGRSPWQPQLNLAEMLCLRSSHYALCQPKRLHRNMTPGDLSDIIRSYQIYQIYTRMEECTAPGLQQFSFCSLYILQ